MSRARGTMSLAEAADELGVHYMTAYRYVRTGRLPATKDGAEWTVKRADVATFRHHQSVPKGRGSRRASYPSELQDRLLHADEAGAWGVIEQGLASGMEPSEVLLDLLSPAMAGIGEGWARGEISVAEEHQATATATRLVGRLGPRFARRGRKRGLVIVGAPADDTHGLPSAIVGDLLRGRGFAVTDLGPDAPAESWAATATATGDGTGPPGLVSVGVCATTPDNDEAVAETIAAIHRTTPAPVVLGGHGVTSSKHAEALGADRYSGSAAEVVDIIDELTRLPR